jgi:peptidyl-dipeptidase Dcp
MNIGDIKIRTKLQSGDLGYVIHLHGKLYKNQYDFGIEFESYVALGLHDFFHQYNPIKDRVWIAEHKNIIIGSLMLMHHENNTAQLRYFLIEPEYRGIGLGRKMMNLFMEFLHASNYQSAFLLTTHELTTAASLYIHHGFKLTEEKTTNSFGKPLKEQRYDLLLMI